MLKNDRLLMKSAVGFKKYFRGIPHTLQKAGQSSTRYYLQPNMSTGIVLEVKEKVGSLLLVQN